MSVPAPRTLPECVLRFAPDHGDRVSLRDKHRGIWREWTWREYYEQLEIVGCMLWELGVRPGESIGVLSDNRPEWLFADLGAQGIGARSVGIYQTNPPADVAYVLNHSRISVLFCEDQEQVDKAVEVADQTPSLRHVVVFDARGTGGYCDERLLSWDAFVQRGRSMCEEGWFAQQLEQRDPDAAAMVVYTSGTTGQPKGAMLSSRNVLETAAGMAPVLGVGPADTVLSYLPLCHVAEKIFSAFLPLTVGGVVHFGESIDTIQADLREVSPTIFLGVPRIWEKLHAMVSLKMQDASWLKRALYQRCVPQGIALAKARRSGSLGWVGALQWFLCDLLVFRALQERMGLRRCQLPCSGAAPISSDLLEWFHGIGIPISEGYGMTECGGVSHMNPPGGVQLGTVGECIPAVACRIAPDGEILLQGPNVFLGYLNNEEATRETIDDDGWLHTGDLGSVDARGYLSITGRKKEIIITAGGKNLSPEKIENALKMSPYIKEAVAVGDGRKFVSALVQVDGDSAGDWATRQKVPYTSYEDLVGKEEIRTLIAAEIARSNELLARVEQARSFRILPKELHQDDGELTATQKVRRRAVQERFGSLIEAIYGGGHP